MKKQLHDYYEKKIENIPINTTLEKKIESHFYSADRNEKSESHSFFDAIKKYSLPLVSAASIFSLLFIIPFYSTPKTENRLGSTIVLAEAIENTIDTNTLVTTFGVTPSDLFQKRTVALEYLKNNEENEIEEKKTFLHIWTKNDRSRHDTEEIDTIIASSLIEESKNQFCHYSAGQETACKKTEEITKERLDLLKMFQLKETKKEDVLKNISVEQFDPSLFLTSEAGATKTIAWELTNPLEKNEYTQIIYIDPFLEEAGTKSDGTREKTEINRIGITENPKNKDHTLFAQVVRKKETNDHPENHPILESSLVYEIDTKKMSATPISYELFLEKINAVSPYDQKIYTEYHSAIQPILYIIENEEEFAIPSRISQKTINEKTVTEFEYKLNEESVYAMQNSFFDTLREKNNSQIAATTIVLWVDEKEKFIGYAIYDAENVQLYKLIIEDSLITKIDADTFFTPEYWKEEIKNNSFSQ